MPADFHSMQKSDWSVDFLLLWKANTQVNVCWIVSKWYEMNNLPIVQPKAIKENSPADMRRNWVIHQTPAFCRRLVCKTKKQKNPSKILKGCDICQCDMMGESSRYDVAEWLRHWTVDWEVAGSDPIPIFSPTTSPPPPPNYLSGCWAQWLALWWDEKPRSRHTCAF